MNNIYILNLSHTINGSVSFLYEIGFYLQDKGFDVTIIEYPHNYVDYQKRYDMKIKCVSTANIDLTKPYILLCNDFYFHILINNINFQKLFNKAQKIFCVFHSHANTNLNFFHEPYLKNIRTFIKIYKKIHLLYDSDLIKQNTDLDQYYFSRFPTTHISWGIYYSSLKHIHTYSNNDIYLLYDRSFRNYTQSIPYAENYCKQNDIKYKKIIYNDYDCFDPWNYYAGLVYVRHTDYSPRLPFEFGFFQKPTIVLESSEGLRILATNLEYNKSVILHTNKNIHIPINIFKNW